MTDHGSKSVAAAAVKMSLSERDEEKSLSESFLKEGIKAAAVDFGGDFITSINKIIERAVVAAKREGIIRESHAEQGSVAGAAREATAQIMTKAMGLNIGGKIGIARCEEHVAVAVFFGVGLLHLNEVAIGLGHRVI